MTRKAKEPSERSVLETAEAARAFGSTLGETWKSMSGLNLPIPALTRLQTEYIQQAASLWNATVSRVQTDGEVETKKPLPDRRFAADAWAQNPAAAYVAQMYLLNARTLMQMAESLEGGDEKLRQRIRFAVSQWIDAASPSNFLALNPEAQKKALDSQGESLALGLQNLLGDVQRGHVSQTDESVFEVGRNVATTAGSVVYENEYFQLIEYTPTTAKVYERPFLFVPPCINKYYILDLQPENSLIRYVLDQGHRAYVVSWRNPDESMSQKTWDDYIEEGAIRAIHEVQAISKSEQINALGFCVGGTILATALAVLAARGEEPASSVTFLTVLLDFTHTGVLDLFIDEAAVQVRELTIGESSASGGGLLKGQELATTFSFLRPNDLVWNYVVGNYLKGESPPPFDLLYWNGDSTNLPGPMYCWYLRHTYLQNELREPGKLTVCGEQIDLGKVKVPVYFYASREDHIVPWDSSYMGTSLIGSTRRFVLGASGHIAGVINPPAKKKRNYWTGPARLPKTANEWFEQATEHPGSWWPDWADWLKTHAGRQVAAPKTAGDRAHPVIEPAPGRYVKAKA